MHRRQFIATAAAAGSSLLLKNAPGAESKRFEGIFPIVQTPFKDSGALDTDTLSNEVSFLHRMGVQGMTWPQNASEWSLLTPDERFAGAEAIVRANKAASAATRPSIVIGVQAATAEAALPFARHAEKIGADGIIAIPFKNGVGTDESKQMEYYSAIASACSKPLCVQAIGDIGVDQVLRMAKQNPTIQYVKDEAGVTLPRLTEYARHEQETSRRFLRQTRPDLPRGTGAWCLRKHARGRLCRSVRRDLAGMESRQNGRSGRSFQQAPGLDSGCPNLRCRRAEIHSATAWRFP